MEKRNSLTIANIRFKDCVYSHLAWSREEFGILSRRNSLAENTDSHLFTFQRIFQRDPLTLPSSTTFLLPLSCPRSSLNFVNNSIRPYVAGSFHLWEHLQKPADFIIPSLWAFFCKNHHLENQTFQPRRRAAKIRHQWSVSIQVESKKHPFQLSFILSWTATVIIVNIGRFIPLDSSRPFRGLSHSLILLDPFQFPSIQ